MKPLTLKNYLGISKMILLRKGAGVAERDGLENRCWGNLTEGSNPSLSAKCNKWTISELV